MLIDFILGLLFIGLGFLVKSFPDLIAGYNTLPREKKKNVDIAGLSACMKKGLICIGAAIIVCSLLLHLFQLDDYSFIPMIAICLIGPIILLVKVQKYDHNGKRNRNKNH